MKTQFPQVTRYLLSPFCMEQELMVWNIGIFAFNLLNFYSFSKNPFLNLSLIYKTCFSFLCDLPRVYVFVFIFTIVSERDSSS